MKELKKLYRNRKAIIKKRILEFERIKHMPYDKLFGELCFCICTPQSKAVLADRAIAKLRKKGSLLKGDLRCVRECLAGVRFPNNKSRFIINARKIDLIEILSEVDDARVRERIVKEVKGIGFKEASHYLRNIGRASDLAILDVHILRNLKRLGVIKTIPKTLTKKVYLGIENDMRRFSKKSGIPLRELDLLFWSRETGHVFK